MERLFVDTSAWFAYANRADREHRAVGAVLRSLAGRLTTSNFVLDETLTLCRYRLGHAAAMRVGEALQRSAEVDLVRVTAADERSAWTLFGERPDQRYSFTDCTSFVLMRRLGIGTALALDADFTTEGFHLMP